MDSPKHKKMDPYKPFWYDKTERVFPYQLQVWGYFLVFSGKDLMCMITRKNDCIKEGKKNNKCALKNLLVNFSAFFHAEGCFFAPNDCKWSEEKF